MKAKLTLEDGRTISIGDKVNGDIVVGFSNNYIEVRDSNDGFIKTFEKQLLKFFSA